MATKMNRVRRSSKAGFSVFGERKTWNSFTLNEMRRMNMIKLGSLKEQIEQVEDNLFS